MKNLILLLALVIVMLQYKGLSAKSNEVIVVQPSAMFLSK